MHLLPDVQGHAVSHQDEQRLFAEIDEMAALRPWRRVFLADGDALIIPQPRLVRIWKSCAGRSRPRTRRHLRQRQGDHEEERRGA
jgi:hypothetical protein